MDHEILVALVEQIRADERDRILDPYGNVIPPERVAERMDELARLS